MRRAWWLRCEGRVLAIACLVAAFAALPTAPAFGPVPGPDFVETFERPGGWGLFEEIVGGDPCYGAGIGEHRRDAEAAHFGAHGLAIVANAAGTPLSNHVIVNQRLHDHGLTSVMRYVVHGRIPVDNAATTQAGPEFSVQNTRTALDGSHVTHIAGFQYVANPWSAPDWNLWTTAPSGESATWMPIHTQPLTPGVWYRFTLDFDFVANRYLALHVQGSDLDVTLPLVMHAIVAELRWDEEAFWVTLEAENLWGNCGQVSTQTTLHYDDVALYVL